MSAPKYHPRRPDLLYRNMIPPHPDDVDDVAAVDPRLRSITDKVIDYMARTDPENWTKDQWTLFKTLWTEARSPRKPVTTTASMSMDELKNSLRGARSTSEPSD